MFIPYNHRHFDRRFQEQEARLCHKDAPKESTDRSNWDPRGWLQTVAEYGTRAVGEVAAFTTESVARIPIGIANGIYKVAEGKMELAQKLLRKAVNFTTTAPQATINWVSQIFEENQEMSEDAMANFMDLRQWIEGFEGVNLKDPTSDVEKSITEKEMESAKTVIAAKVASKNPFTPGEYLKSLSPYQRRERFAQIVMGVIPNDTQNKPEFGKIFGDLDPTDRRNAIKDAQPTLVSAMKKMYGLAEFDDPDSSAEKIAKDSLAQMLFLNKRGNDKKFGASGGLKEEFQAHLRRRPGMMTPEGITAELAIGVKPEASLLLGAVKGGVLKQEDINNMMPGLENNTTKQQQESGDQRRILEETIRASRAELKLASETMSQRWDKAPGWAKLAVVVGIIGGVMKFPKISMAIGAFFAGKYFLMKDNNPLDSTGNNILSAMSFLRGAKVAPALGQASAVTQLGEQVLSFLPNQAHENINTSVTGFALLAGMDVSLLATHAEPNDPTGRMVTLRAWDQPLRTAIKGSLKDRGLDPVAASRFFPSGDPRPKDAEGKPAESVDCSKNRNLCDTGDALASVFYLLGELRVRTGRNENPFLDVTTLDKIEQVRRSSTGSGYYDDIADDLKMDHPQRGSLKVRDEYYKVMLEGMAEARSRPKQSLEQVMRELAAKPQSPDKPSASEGAEKYASAKSTVENYEYPKGVIVGFKVNRDVNKNVTIDLYPTSSPAPLTMSPQDFVRKNPAEIVQEWLSRVNLAHREGQLKAKMQSNSIKHTYGADFNIQRSPSDREKVLFAPVISVQAPGTLPVAASSIYKLMKTDDQVLLNKYEIYEKGVGLGSVSPGSDPL